MAFKVSAKKGINIKRVVTKVATTVIVLYVGGTLLNEVGNVMNGTCSPFYQGLTLIGWTVEAGTCDSVADTANTITSTAESGILAVVGIVAIASIVLEFIQVQF